MLAYSADPGKGPSNRFDALETEDAYCHRQIRVNLGRGVAAETRPDQTATARFRNGFRPAESDCGPDEDLPSASATALVLAQRTNAH